ncbi:MAG: response regulator [Thermodesulfobacterium sp.]|nr:response regulator [Thermodesulfobacterium sp.]
MKKILIVEDALTVRLYYHKVLSENGFEVDMAINGVEGLEKVLQKGYDLFIVDINMPKMDGYTFLRELRTNREIIQAPAIVITTEDKREDKEKALKSGANLYLVKPVKSLELLIYAKLLTGVKL